MIETAPEVLAIISKAEKAGVKMPPVLRRAGIPERTWYGWTRQGIDPQVGKVRRVKQALYAIIAEREKA
jgi:hypothetical protein